MTKARGGAVSNPLRDEQIPDPVPHAGALDHRAVRTRQRAKVGNQRATLGGQVGRAERSGTPRVVGAVLGAVIATVVYVGLGINLLLPILIKAPLGSELAVFAFAALGGWLGLKAGAGGEAPASPKPTRRTA